MTDITNKMRAVVVLDRSGSMASTRDLTISGYNEYIGTLRADKETDIFATLIQFDTPEIGSERGRNEMRVVYEDLPLADVPLLTRREYEPRGMTPLYDAVGMAMNRPPAADSGITVTIISDGLDNTSREFTRMSANDLVGKRRAEGWVVNFIGCNMDAIAQAAKFNIPVGNAANYNPLAPQKVFRAMASATSRKAADNRQYGVRASSQWAFFDEKEKKEMEEK